MAADVFTTLAAIKAWLNTSGNTEDTALTALASAINVQVSRYIFNGNPILLNQYTEIRDGNSKNRMVLRNYPIQVVLLVQVDAYVLQRFNPFAVTQTLQSGLIGNNIVVPGGFVNDQYAVSLQGYEYRKDRQNVKFIYGGGYGNALSQAATIPASPFQITVSGFSAAGFVDLGVQYANGNLLTPVASGPGQGQYSVNTGTGVYTFSLGDVGAAITINYGNQVAPADLAQATTEWAAKIYRSKNWIGQKSYVDRDQGNTMYDTGPMPAQVKLVMDAYKRKGMAGR